MCDVWLVYLFKYYVICIIFLDLYLNIADIGITFVKNFDINDLMFKWNID